MTTASARAVRLDALSYSYPSSARALFVSFDAHFVPGWTGVAGPNGAGKSTLLRLIVGELEPDAGRVSIEPAGAAVALCRQEVGALDSATRRFAQSWDADARRLASRLELGDGWVDDDSWRALSPGARRRFQIAAALWARPSVLLVDEPTNHLDAPGRALLGGALAAFDGVGLIVSHDRALLDELCDRVLWLERGREPLAVDGAWREAQRAIEARDRSALDALDTASAAIKCARARLHDARRAAAQASRSTNAGARMSSRRDTDAGSMNAKGRARRASASLSRSAASAASALERAQSTRAALGAAPPRTSVAVAIQHEVTASDRALARIEPGAIRIDEHVIVRAPRLDWGSRDRVWLRGPNGAGKTTLLGALRASVRGPRERLLWLPQLFEPGALAALRSRLSSAGRDEKARWLALAAHLGADPRALLHEATLSPGQARKLALAEGLARGVSGIALDEPTNDLDLPAVEAMESALRAYPGAILIATHDNRLARGIARRAWTVVPHPDGAEVRIEPLEQAGSY